MKVPSSVVDGDFNYLFNPEHKDAGKIKIVRSEKFSLDLRPFKENSNAHQLYIMLIFSISLLQENTKK